MSLALVGLAVLMFGVTYPSRAIPLLAPHFERLPPPVLAYLQLVGPAVLGAIAAVETFVGDAEGQPVLVVGPEALAVVACAGIVAWRRNLALGLLVAIVLLAGLRAVGVA